MKIVNGYTNTKGPTKQLQKKTIIRLHTFLIYPGLSQDRFAVTLTEQTVGVTTLGDQNECIFVYFDYLSDLAFDSLLST